MTSTCHDVIESGAVSDMFAYPSPPVRMQGSQYHVSGKYWRTIDGRETVPLESSPSSSPYAVSKSMSPLA